MAFCNGSFLYIIHVLKLTAKALPNIGRAPKEISIPIPAIHFQGYRSRVDLPPPTQDASDQMKGLVVGISYPQNVS